MQYTGSLRLNIKITKPLLTSSLVLVTFSSSFRSADGLLGLCPGSASCSCLTLFHFCWPSFLLASLCYHLPYPFCASLSHGMFHSSLMFTKFLPVHLVVIFQYPIMSSSFCFHQQHQTVQSLQESIWLLHLPLPQYSLSCRHNAPFTEFPNFPLMSAYSSFTEPAQTSILS